RISRDWSSDVCSSDLILPFGLLYGDLTPHGRDLTFKASDTSFPSVGFNEGIDRVISELNLLTLKTVEFALLGDQKLACDGSFLVGRISGDLDHLHAIHERRRDPRAIIRRSKKSHFAEIER